ncbi:uncharacterized protein SOCE26_051310 [Sorangium cellulosum]|uniref:Protein kinase domain-containing protein n=1 Tax=Sorangium cellulosum TaxID=56 RepID=A0A2L0EWP9_SORCE|nr:serine/threonine-protein kinase [Sorangium cellulosum]AUX43679.1 uncharacterized protein SOCE26_051310 [Sorangium cellulosum]
MASPILIGFRYRILRELGRGGMGVVYLVEHTHTGDQLALKVLLAHSGANPETVERFKREARAPARIRSEHIVKVTDSDVAPELGGAPFLVMELLNGQDLEKLLKVRQRLEPIEVITILMQVARALDKAHGMGIVHRDLKPDNIFLHEKEDGSTIVKILDFGISKLGGEGLGGIEQAGLTQQGSLIGTPLYMSPEQARGDAANVSPACDVWAIGLIAFRLLTGRHFWTARTLAELIVQIMNEPITSASLRFPGVLPPAFDPWFARSCDRNPTSRWASIGEQAQALGVALGIDAHSLALSNSWTMRLSTDGRVRVNGLPFAQDFSPKGSWQGGATPGPSRTEAPFSALTPQASGPASTSGTSALSGPVRPSRGGKLRIGVAVGIVSAVLAVAALAALFLARSSTTATPEIPNVPTVALTSAASPATVLAAPPATLLPSAPLSSIAPAESASADALTAVPTASVTPTVSSPAVTGTAATRPTAAVKPSPVKKPPLVKDPQTEFNPSAP